MAFGRACPVVAYRARSVAVLARNASSRTGRAGRATVARGLNGNPWGRCDFAPGRVDTEWWRDGASSNSPRARHGPANEKCCGVPRRSIMKATFALLLLAILAVGASGCCGNHPLRDRWSHRGQPQYPQDNCCHQQQQNPCCATTEAFIP